MSTLTTDDFLAHFGVAGMKWGHRKAEEHTSSSKSSTKVEPTPVLTQTFKSGESVSIYRDPPPALGKILARLSSTIRENQKNGANFTLRDKEGNKVGDASFDRRSPEELNLVWIGIKSKHRGKGYAGAALKGVVQYARTEGVKQLTLEVPGNAPDARHIYEKLGFRDDPLLQKKYNDKAGEDISDPKNDSFWGGLTVMSLSVDQVSHTLSDDSAWESEYAEEFANFLIKNVKKLSSTNSLQHNGVKGMKWGKHTAAQTNPTRLDRKVAKQQFDKAYKVLAKDDEKNFFDDSITEKQYSSLSKTDTQYVKGKEFYRVVLSKNANKQFGSMTYVSDNQKDRDRYRSTIPDLLGKGGARSYKKHDELILQATKNIRSPSEKERVDAFSSLIDTPSITLKNGKQITGREYLKKTGWAPQVKSLDSHKAGLKYYNTFVSDLMSDTPLNTAYFNSLQKKGYSALIDDNDAKKLSNTPLIVLNPSGSLKRIGQSQLSNKDINEAQKKFTIALQD